MCGALAYGITLPRQEGVADALGTREVSTSTIKGWRPESLPGSSGCDSSDCAYCQALARLRQPGAAAAPGPHGCWLRRKRSRTDLAAMESGAAATSPTTSGEGHAADQDLGSSVPRVPSVGTLAAAVAASSKQPRLGSMWDHALLEESSASSSSGSAAAAAAAAQVVQRRRDARLAAKAAAAAAAGAVSVSPAAAAAGATAADLSSAHLGNSGSASPEDDYSVIFGGSGSSGGGYGGGISSDAMGWYPSWHSPAALHEVATFLPPSSQCHRRSTDIVCALEFEEHGWLLASAGVAKQVRVYSLASCLQHPDDPAFRQPIRCHRMPSKLSSLCWNPDAPGAVTVADYDGVLSQVDLESGHLIAEADEHGGRRVWSVSHSLHRPHLCASAGEDGAVRLWGGPALQRCVAALHPAGGAPACGVHLSPFDANLAAVACADHSAYIYDLRRYTQPLLQLSGHSRALSYVRWLGPGRLATASTDASLAIWQLPGLGQAPAAAAAAAAAEEATWNAQTLTGPQPPQHQQMAAGGCSSDSGSSAAAAEVLTQPWRRLRGHRNSKNFCGLSVRPEDCLVACGSEAPACYAYHQSWSSPLAVHSFSASAAGQQDPCCGSAHCGGHSAAQGAGHFCSAVCWQPATARLGAAPLLAAAVSSGELRVLELRRPAAAAFHRRCIDG